MIADDAVYVAQRTFRALLSALAHPGRTTPIDEAVDAPAELGPALAAAALTLFDQDVAVWAGAAGRSDVGLWLVERTGCRLVPLARDAHFAVILDPKDALPLARWNPGIPEDPEESATLLVRVDALAGGPSVTLAGPGIQDDVTIAPRGLPERFWPEWAANAARYPLGIECLLFDARCVAGLARTTKERGSRSGAFIGRR